MKKFFANYLVSFALGILVSLGVAWLLKQLNQYKIISNETSLYLYVIQMTLILPTTVTFLFVNLAKLSKIVLMKTLSLAIITDLLFTPLFFVSILSWANLVNRKPEIVFDFNLDTLSHGLIFFTLFTSIMYLINEWSVNKKNK